MDASPRDLIGYVVDIETTDATLSDYLERCYEVFPRASVAAHRCAVAPGPDGGYELRIDGAFLGYADEPGGLVAAVVGHLNRLATEQAPHLLVHAGGVERDGVGVVLAAPMESGKSTLTAGLTVAGFRYLTDEAVAVDRVTATIVPYPKPLSLDRGSWSLFPTLEPDAPFATDSYKNVQWQVPPTAIGSDAVGGPCRVGIVCFPVFTPGGSTRLEPLSRAEGLVELAKNTFGFEDAARPAFELLAEVVRDAEVYRLPNGDLDAAVDTVSSLF